MLRLVACLVLINLVRAEPFFAMDTGITGNPARVAETLHELGYDGLGGSATSARPMREALEERGSRLWNVYLTLKFQTGTPPLSPELRRAIDELKGHDAALWIAISEVSGGDEVAVEALNEIADHAKGAGVKLSLYPHAGFWLARFSDAARLANLVDRAEVGITFNLCHWLKVEGDIDPVPAIAKEAKRLQFVTINGADRGDTKSMGWNKLIQTLDRGSYDTGALVRRLRDEVKWIGPIGLQAFGIPGGQRQNLARSMAAWRKMDGTLDGMVLCGYQGWHRCEGDGANLGWMHYAPEGAFEASNTHIEMWPDMSEMGPEERFATPLRHADGSVAEVFSPMREATVRRHFRWMREHGIDGAFVQRFAVDARDPRHRAAMDTVLAHCRAAATAEGRAWSIMFDLSGLKREDFPTVKGDWEHLKRGGFFSTDGSYLRYRSKPLVSLWGIGFNDREPSLPEWETLIRFLKEQGCAVMLGVPCYWRTLDRDSIQDPKLHDLISLADIVSPWSVGRFGTPQDAAGRVGALLKPDLAWCRERKLDYLPVIFPGFSWHNLERSRGREAKFDAIPRLDGEFLWSQAIAGKQAGAKALYVAMFDEIDEGTAIFKTTPSPPVGGARFLSMPELPSDHYLWLTGEIGRLMRGERRSTEEIPSR